MEFWKQNRAAIIVVTLLVIGGSFFVGFKAGENGKVNFVPPVSLTNTATGAPDGVDFAPFWKAWNTINEKFAVTKATTTAPVTDQDKVWGAIQGLTKSLGDPYTVFFPPEESKAFQNEISGTFEGVGMEVGIKDGVITVVAPLKNTPAYRAGVLSGDRILKINERLTNDMTVDQAVKLIRGPRGTVVTLNLFRNGRKDSFDLKITRDVIDIPTIDTEVKPGIASAGGDSADQGGLQKNGVFIIKLYSFSATSPQLFRNALREFVLSGSHKLILDLRGNPGGYLEAAVDIASWFLPFGQTVVSEEYAAGKPADVYKSRGYNVFAGQPLDMIILVNEGSASASEILSGALQEYGIAKLVGTKTFGKGSVQELVTITSDTSLKVTIARWLTPKGRSISEQGLKPDVEVKITEADLSAKRDPQMDKAVQLLQRRK